ncbi:MAG: hypothetical protein LLF97_07480 [Planctomycetaceae bacterium]|nr:hypothetical protein [Planctomycetaceae bacterium]
MKLAKMVSVEDLQVASRFGSLRKILLSDAYADHLNKPLAYWALPTDRRLPLAFLSRTLRDLLNDSLAELSATPGIGRKKIASFVQLLARAANTDPASLPAEALDPVAAAAASGEGSAEGGDLAFDPTNISEVMWAQWRADVVRHGLGGEAIGRFAPSLRHMTRVIWNTPLGEYTGVTLAEIRAMRTHGEKRIHALLEVFHAIHTITAGMGRQEHLVVRIVPRCIDRVEQWIGRALQRPGIPDRQELFDEFVQPLLEQIRLDATQQIAALAENRLGIHGPITSVRQVARTMGLTRARVYQLLNEINDILTVRWPTGRHQAHELRERLLADAARMDEAPDLRQFHAAVELFYPGNRRGAAGPLEQAIDVEPESDAVVEAS